jgi:hypothetical protein
MRVLFFLLLVANLVLAAFALLRPAADGEPQLLQQQLNADQIRIIPPRPLAPPQPRKATCVDWGNFSAAELASARRALEPLQLGERISEREVSVIASWWVYIPPLKNKAEVERKIAELEQLGVTEYYAVDTPGPMRFAISLGIFRTEEAANGFLDALRQKGVRSATVGNRDYRLTLTALRVRDPDARVSARLAELHAQFPGTELKALDCPP